MRFKTMVSGGGSKKRIAQDRNHLHKSTCIYMFIVIQVCSVDMYHLCLLDTVLDSKGLKAKARGPRERTREK